MFTASTGDLHTGGVSTEWRKRVMPAAVAAALGAVLVYAAGFAQFEQVHEAAHDVRHSAALPCH